MPIYNFVKDDTGSVDENKKNWTFSKWRNGNLDIDLIKGTSVLNISYKDQDKKIIKQVLNKISSAYQVYSRKDKVNSLNSGLKYLEEQISAYKDKTFESYKDEKSFSSRYNLSPTDLDDQIISKLSNEIKIIELNLEILKNIDNTDDEIYHLAMGLNKNKTDPPKALMQFLEIEYQLAERRTFFKENDNLIQSLLKRKQSLLIQIKASTEAMLRSMRLEKLAQLDSYSRPIELKSQYKQKVVETQRNELILRRLEDSLLSLKLEKSREIEPWELITNPTLLDKPVSSSTAKIIASSILLGFFFSLIFIYIKQSLKAIIYSKDSMQSLLGIQKILTLDSRNIDSWNETLNLLAINLMKNNKEIKIALLPLGEINNEELNKVTSIFNKSYQTNSLIICSNLLELDSFDEILIITSMGIVRKKEVKEFVSKIMIQDKPILGWVEIK